MKRSVNRGNITTVFSNMGVGDTFTLPSTVTFTEAMEQAKANGLTLTNDHRVITVLALPNPRFQKVWEFQPAKNESATPVVSKAPYRRKMPLSQLRREVTALSFSDFLSPSH